MLEFSPDAYSFSAAYDQGRAQLVWATLYADLETPVSAAQKLLPTGEPGCLLESVVGGEIRGRYSVLGFDPDMVWRCFGDRAESAAVVPGVPLAELDFVSSDVPAMQSLQDLLDASALTIPVGLPPMAAGLVGYLGYEMVRLMEHLPTRHDDVLGIPDGLLIRPRMMAIFDTVAGTIMLVTPVRPAPSVTAEQAFHDAKARIMAAYERLQSPLPGSSAAVPQREPKEEVQFSSNTTRADYYQMVEKAKEYIRAGDIFQVVPSQRFSAPFSLPGFSLYRSLRALNPSPFLFYLDLGGFQLVGSSPEILVRVRDGVVTVRPIAGTRPRGKTPEEDQALADDLIADQKEVAEHLMLLDLGRNDVGRVAAAGSVRVTEQMVIERYSHVMHIVSNVEGQLAKDKSVLDALVAGFPAGTVSGAPKIRAMQIIDELEKTRRGFYAGAVGYFSANGNMDTCIALRTALLKDGQLHLQAGGGVVADSDPDAEYQESCNKAKALMRAATLAQVFA